ncbi:hypothetical protein AWC38_SpisGene24222 [Stylophora pistillata]|uniref:Uncharacterized protein n=1 Tax=Stylophora pistillata TaxID=50429 RepID=A0A2B4R506_STYPI|nr:hypothetical protein AWC38_SpisGene24222 [Stylophora pistillata]
MSLRMISQCPSKNRQQLTEANVLACHQEVKEVECLPFDVDGDCAFKVPCIRKHILKATKDGRLWKQWVTSNRGKFITRLVNFALNCTRKPISHESLRDSCDIGFQVQFNAEFTSQNIKQKVVKEINPVGHSFDALAKIKEATDKNDSYLLWKVKDGRLDGSRIVFGMSRENLEIAEKI